MESVALIHSGTFSSWKSCRFIVSGLESAYLSSAQISEGYNIRSFQIGAQTAASQRIKNIGELRAFAPKVIVLIDEGAHSPWFLGQIAPQLTELASCRFIIHCFGDFYHHARAWLDAETYLHGKRVRFIAASEKSKRLLENFLTSDSISICPFPVRDNEFYWDPKERSETRGKLEIRNDEILLTYAGRLSLQKNIFELTRSIDWLAKAPHLRGRQIVIAFAGGFDQVGLPFELPQRRAGEYAIIVREAIRRIELRNRLRVKYLGELDSSNLRMLFNSADCFISFSLHHNEDFGMAVGEALLTGLPAILTDWGGYSDFASYSRPGSVKYVSVSRNPENTPILNLDAQLSGFIADQASGMNDLLATRRERSEIAKFHLGLTASAERADKLLSTSPFPRFTRFSPFLSGLIDSDALAREFLRYHFNGPIMNRLYRHYDSTDLLLDESRTIATRDLE